MAAALLGPNPRGCSDGVPGRVPAVPAEGEVTASLYVRLSKEAGAAQTGLASQEEDGRALAASLGLTVVGVHTDDGESGDKRSREAYAAWLADATEGRATHLIAYSIDRVNRGGLAALATFLDIVEGRNPDGSLAARGPIRFLSTSDGLDSESPDWTIRVSVMAGLAKAERERMSARARRAHKARKDAGRFAGGTVPYGLRLTAHPSGKGKVLEPDPEAIELLREAGQRLADGESLGRVARWLTAHGPSPRRADAWSRTTVRRALTGPASAYFPAEERAAIRAAAARGGTRPERVTRAPARVLAGLLLCDSCGGVLRLSGGSSGPLYRCDSYARNTGGIECPSGRVISADGADRLISEAWLAGWGPLERMVSVRVADETGHLLALAGERVAELAPAVLAARGPERLHALRELEAAEAERDRLAALPVSSLRVLRATGRTYAEEWHAGTTEDRRELLAETVGFLTVGPGRRGAHLRDLSRFPDSYRLDPAGMPPKVTE